MSRDVTPSYRPAASILLVAAAFALAGVGITTNGWFARSLGSSDIAGWLFLAIGVAADLAALVMPFVPLGFGTPASAPPLLQDGLCGR